MPEFVAKGMKGEYKPVKRPTVDRRRGRLPRHRLRAERARADAGVRRGRRPGFARRRRPGCGRTTSISFVDGEPVVSIKAFQRVHQEEHRPGHDGPPRGPPRRDAADHRADARRRTQPRPVRRRSRHRSRQGAANVRSRHDCRSIHAQVPTTTPLTDRSDEADIPNQPASLLIALAVGVCCTRLAPPRTSNEATEKAMKAASAKVAPSVVKIETAGGTEVIGGGKKGRPAAGHPQGRRPDHRPHRRPGRATSSPVPSTSPTSRPTSSSPSPAGRSGSSPRSSPPTRRGC